MLSATFQEKNIPKKNKKEREKNPKKVLKWLFFPFLFSFFFCVLQGRVKSSLLYNTQNKSVLCENKKNKLIKLKRGT